MSGRVHLQMLRDAKMGMDGYYDNSFIDVVEDLLSCLDGDFDSSITWSVTVGEFDSIREAARWWNLNKYNY